MTTLFGIITNCTARKRAFEPVARLGTADLIGEASTVAERWVQTTAATPRTATAGELYVGRAMSESKAVAAQLKGSLHVISAGLGLAAREDRVPNYDLTVAGGAGSLAAALAQAGSSTSDWWRQLNKLRSTPMPLSRLVNRHRQTRFLLALPSAYLQMLAGDLSQVHDGALDRLYIFTSSSGAKSVPARLLPCVLPYDERLEGHKAYAGTRSDFPQRAMRHFVEQLHAHCMTRQGARKAVDEALGSLKKPLIPKRERKTDVEILEVIRAQWDKHAGNSYRLHRYLRDTVLIACEQSRFSGLCHQVKAERE